MLEAFYTIDLIIGLAIIALVVVMAHSGRMGPFKLRMFVAGVLIGALWEFPLHFLGPEYSTAPIYTRLTEFPLPAILQPALHCIWDGAIFMVGVWLVERLTPAPYFVRFRMSELAVLMGWGLGSALVVELIGSMGGWVYTVYWWNPALITVNSGAITLLPLLIWLVAPVLFYVVALNLRRRYVLS